MKLLRTKKFKLMLIIMIFLCIIWPINDLVFDKGIDGIDGIGGLITDGEHNPPAIEVGNDYQVV